MVSIVRLPSIYEAFILSNNQINPVWLNAFRILFDEALSGVAAEDLDGAWPDITVTRINGSLLGSTTPTNTNILIADGTQWVSKTVSGDVSLTSAGAVALAATAVTAGSYGNATQVGAFTVDTKGRLVAASNITITPAASSITGVLGETQGGTGQSTYTQGDLLYSSASNTLSKLAKNTTSTRYLSNQGASNGPSWSQVNLADGVTGTLSSANLTTASQADQETSTSTTALVTPSVQQYHPSAAKAWCSFDSAGTIAASYNITSITDNGTGDWTVNIGTDFSTANFAAIACGGARAGVAYLNYTIIAVTAGTARVNANSTVVVLVDPDTPDLIFFAAFGDQ